MKSRAASEFREKAKAALHEAGLHDEAIRLDQAMIGTVYSVADGFIRKNLVPPRYQSGT